MPGPNTTGLPKTEDYNLGRGVVYFATIDGTTGLPIEYRDLGNAPEFSISVEVEKLEHQSSRAGLKVTDKEVIISQKINVSLTLDEINFENLAALLSGAVAKQVTNAGETMQAQFEAYPSVALGRWYDVRNASDVRAYGFDTDSGGLHPELDLFNDMMQLVQGTEDDGSTDYKCDGKFGRIFLFSQAPNITDGDPLDFAWTAVTPGDLHEVRSLTKTAVLGAMKFISENPANDDHQTEFQFHQISLKAEGDFSLIGEEFTTMQFSGIAERNVSADADSPTLTIRDIPTYTPTGMAT